MFSVERAVVAVEGLDTGLRIHVPEPVRLRDYFLRLGAFAEIVTDGAVPVVLVHGDDLNIKGYLETWATVNSTEVSVSPTAPATAPAIGLLPSLRPRLGDLLVGKGMITEPQLGEALIASRERGELLGRVLLRRQWIYEDELARTLAEQLDLPYVNLRNTGVHYAVARLIPSETGIQFAAIPINVRGNRISVAFADPCDEQAHQAVTMHVSDFVSVVAELSDIEQAWRTLERRSGPPERSQQQIAANRQALYKKAFGVAPSGSCLVDCGS